MSTKKATQSKGKSSAKKPVPAKKPAAPAKKSAAAKKPAPAKKPAAAKKPAPAKKPAAVKKPAPAKKPTAPAKKPVAPAKKPTEMAKKPSAPVVPPVTPAAEEATVDSRDFAYSIAEMMKQANRQQEAENAAATQAVRLSRRPTSRSKGKETMKFPDADLAEFRKRLLQLRQAATGQSATLKTIALEQTDDRGGEDEDGSDAFLRLQSLNQVDSQNRTVHMIDEALRRIADGTYGICEICGQLIRKPRLMNMPFVHTCMECQSEMESPYGGSRR